jgi:hypothetical protein
MWHGSANFAQAIFDKTNGEMGGDRGDRIGLALRYMSTRCIAREAASHDPPFKPSRHMLPVLLVSGSMPAEMRHQHSVHVFTAKAARSSLKQFLAAAVLANRTLTQAPAPAGSPGTSGLDAASRRLLVALTRPLDHGQTVVTDPQRVLSLPRLGLHLHTTRIPTSGVPPAAASGEGSGGILAKPGRRVAQVVYGSTEHLPKLEIHASWQQQYSTPHPPHCHDDEELIFVLRGSVRVTHLLGYRPPGSVGDALMATIATAAAANASHVNGAEPAGSGGGGGSRGAKQGKQAAAGVSVSKAAASANRAAGHALLEDIVAGAGDVVYHPRCVPHTITSLSAPDALYVIMRWVGAQKAGPSAPGTTHQLPVAQLPPIVTALPTPEKGKRLLHVLNGPTEYLQRLNVHTTRLMPGDGYKAHADAYDVVIIVAKGQLEARTAAFAAMMTTGPAPGNATLPAVWRSSMLAPFDVHVIPAGVMHGLRNVGSEPSLHVAVELRV